ncbi:MAG: endonuclease III [Actinomycetota bacterium]|nr:endonuclease III [Actinomycetota bacterium]
MTALARPAAARKPRTAQGRTRTTAELLAQEYPGDGRSLCALVHTDPFQLLVATILSAQCTDERVNLVTPSLFSRYPAPEDLARAEPAELEEMIRPTGFFRSKTKSLIAMAAAVDEHHGGQVPPEMEKLTELPGVGRKTANVVRSVAFGLPGLPVDTHVTRLSARLELSSATDPEKIEAELCRYLPRKEWGPLSLRLILHGRAVCTARKPACRSCVLAWFCPSATVAG